MARLTDRELKTLQGKGSERIGGRGAGALLFRRRESGSLEAYYQYRLAGKREVIKLGTYGQITLAEARARCNELAAIRAQHPDLKAYLASTAETEAQAKAATAAAEEAERLRGSLQDLLNDYVADRKAAGAPSAGEIERLITVDFIEKHPIIASTKARDIEPAHIMQLLTPIWDRGAKTQYNRARTYLHAAFQYGLQAEYDVARKSKKAFGLVHNPVAAIRKQAEGENALERALSDEELRHFYHNCERAPKVGKLVTLLLQFIVATAGQRPYRLIVAPWTDYNIEERWVRVTSMKGRGKTRINLIPLTERAIAILEQVRDITGHQQWPWTFKGKTPMAISTPRKACLRFCESEASVLNANTGQRVAPFTPRDLRRTAKQIMQRAGVDATLRDLLQDHNQGGVANKHYANNPHAALPEKIKAISGYDQALCLILGITPF